MVAHLVGRRHQVEELARVVADAAVGDGALVVLAGEAGIGKTTMLAWLADAAASAGMRVLAGRAVADEGAPAFWPWLRVFGAGRDLGLSPDLLELGDGPPAQARFVAIERAAGALLAAVPAAGLLVTLDDVQWADEATVALLRYVGADLPGARLVIAVATREAGAPGQLGGLPAARTLRLPPLTATEVAEYVVGKLGGKPKKASRQDVLGLDMIDRFDKGNFHMRGYTGDDKPDHCAHIGLMADIVRVHLTPRWKSPKGRK